MEDVNLNQLKTVCNLYLEVEFPYFEELREAFYILDVAGCRIEELFQIERWGWVSGYTVTLWPQKNNLQRTIILNENCNNFINAIKGQYKPFLGRTSYQLQYLFRKLNPYIPIYSGGREISLYCYRYKHIWEMQANGFTIEEIRIEMGHRTQTPILLYLAAQINSTYYIEPYNPDPLPPEHIDIISETTIFTGTPPGFRIDRPTTGDLISCFIKGTANLGTSRFLLYPGDIQTRSLGFILAANYSTTTFSFSFSVMNGPGVFVLTFTVPAILSANFKILFTFDISQIVGGNNLYRNIYLNVYTPEQPVVTKSKLSFYFNRGWQPFSTICGSYNNGVFGAQPFTGTLYNYNFWNRILSESEINTLFSL